MLPNQTRECAFCHSVIGREAARRHFVWHKNIVGDVEVVERIPEDRQTSHPFARAGGVLYLSRYPFGGGPNA